MDSIHFEDCLAHIIKNHRSANLLPRLEGLLNDVTYVHVHGIINEQGLYIDARNDISGGK